MNIGNGGYTGMPSTIDLNNIDQVWQANQVSMEIESLLLMPTGSFNPQVIRPYNTHVTGETINGINNVIGNSVPGVTITPRALAGDLSSMLSVSTVAEPAIQVPGGWGENRCLFVLKVRVQRRLGNNLTYFFQGLTSHLGVTATGAIDPQMVFYINSFIGIENVEHNTPNGLMVSERVVENTNILNPTFSLNAGSNLPNQFDSLRPNDIFGGIQVSHLTRGDGVNIFDTRSGLTDPTRSSKSNNSPLDYFSKIVNSYMSSQNDARLGNAIDDQYADILGESMDKSEMSPIKDNPFLKALANQYGTPRSVNQFTLDILGKIDPLIARKTNYLQPTGLKQLGTLPTTQGSEYWNIQTREVIAATIILNSLSAIMFELLISKIHLVSTNMDITGAMNTRIIGSRAMTSADYSLNIQRLIRRFESEVMFDLTFKNQDSYNVDIQVDLFGSSTVSIGFGGREMIPFIQPTFADSYMSPVLTQNPNVKNNLVNDFETILNSVSEVTPRPTTQKQLYNF
jgi:hypothetical protein